MNGFSTHWRAAAVPLFIVVCAFVLAGCGCAEDKANEGVGAQMAGDTGGTTADAILAVHPCGFVDSTQSPIYVDLSMNSPDISVPGAYPMGAGEHYFLTDANGNPVNVSGIASSGTTQSFSSNDTHAIINLQGPLPPGTYKVTLSSNATSGGCASAALGNSGTFTVK